MSFALHKQTCYNISRFLSFIRLSIPLINKRMKEI